MTKIPALETETRASCATRAGAAGRLGGGAGAGPSLATLRFRPLGRSLQKLLRTVLLSNTMSNRMTRALQTFIMCPEVLS